MLEHYELFVIDFTDLLAEHFSLLMTLQ